MPPGGGGGGGSTSGGGGGGGGSGSQMRFSPPIMTLAGRPDAAALTTSDVGDAGDAKALVPAKATTKAAMEPTTKSLRTGFFTSMRFSLELQHLEE